jgi:hypothetical protein
LPLSFKKKIEAFEMWCWRKMNKIKWTERMINERVLHRREKKINLENLRRKKAHMDRAPLQTQ